MKKISVVFVAILFGFGVASSQIPNPGFENWTYGDPDGWITSNIPFAGIINITQSSDHQEGSYAVKGEIIEFNGTPMLCVLMSGPEGNGFPISESYQAVNMYYKFTPVEGDMFSVNIAFQKNGIPIAQGAVAIPTSYSDYTYLSVPMEYQIMETPDTAIIEFMILGPVTGTDVHVGSTMHVDDLSFSFTTGTGIMKEQKPVITCYPNPASQILTIQLQETIPAEAAICIYDINGRMVKEVVNGSGPGLMEEIVIPVNDLPAGLYLYSIRGKDLELDGKFQVSR